MAALDLCDQPLPEAQRLGVGIVDPEDSDIPRAPEQSHVQEFAPQLAPLRALEVERVDVLVLLGWVLRVLDAAVRPVAEPLWVFGHVRMIRRALIGQIDG